MDCINRYITNDLRTICVHIKSFATKWQCLIITRNGSVDAMYFVSSTLDGITQLAHHLPAASHVTQCSSHW